MSRRAVLLDLLWRLTHPREQQERARAEEAAKEAEDQQRQETIFRQHEEDRERWLSLARDPEASPEDLRRLLQEDCQWRKDSPRSRDIVNHLHRLAHSDNGFHTEAYFDALPVAISMHPNIPLDVLGRELAITKHTVTALLKNPICPLLVLERPDFLEMLDANGHSRLSSLAFAYYALRHNRHMALPAGLLALLAACKDPWMALEARTHVCFASGSGTSEQGPPDLTQLDGQVIALLRQETFGRRCLLYQLERYGMIPSGVQPTNPWQEPDFCASFRDACAAEPISTWLQQAIPAAKRARSKQSRRKWWSTYISDLDRSVDYDVVYQVLASHPDAPYWVVEVVARFNPSLLLAALLHPEVPARFVAKHRLRVREHIFSYLKVPSAQDVDCPGTFYLVLRYIPHLLAEWRADASDPVSILRLNIESGHFLARLAIALCLGDANPEDREMRDVLCDDPNRYVRAVARKEITWPKQSG